MITISIENASNKITGYCSSWGIEISAGVFVMNVPANTREEIWGQIIQWARADTKIVMVWSTATTEQGLDWRSIGSPQRRLVEKEGLLLSVWIPQ